LIICVLNVGSSSNTINTKDKVYVMSGMITTYKNLVTGLVSYAHKYLYAVNHDIEITYDNDDVVIIIRIKNVADKIPRLD
jgi:uncharacterized protein YaaR (DUF327 family)